MPEAPRRAKGGVLLVALLLTAVGSCGLSHGVRDLGPPPDAEVAVGGHDNAALDAASQASAQALFEVLESDPNRSALGASNIVVSLLLIWAGISLVSRRPQALWWVRQAAWGNGLWSAADTASQVWQLFREFDRVAAAFSEEVTLRSRELGPEADPALTGGHLVWFLVIVFLGIGTLRVLAYGWFLWRIRKEDIQELFVIEEGVHE